MREAWGGQEQNEGRGERKGRVGGCQRKIGGGVDREKFAEFASTC